MTDFLNADITEAGLTYDTPLLLQGSQNKITTDIHDSKSRILVGPILVQLLLVYEISRSKLALLDAIKSDPDFPKLNEQTTENRSLVNGSRRNIIRLPGTANEDSEDGDQISTIPTTTSFTTPPKVIHKVVLQDTNGLLVYGMELKRLNFLSMNTPLGSKVGI